MGIEKQNEKSIWNSYNGLKIRVITYKFIRKHKHGNWYMEINGIFVMAKKNTKESSPSLLKIIKT